jgi:hypothetical protein
MLVARITTVTFDSKEAADVAVASYVENSPNDFPPSIRRRLKRIRAIRSEL